MSVKEKEIARWFKLADEDIISAQILMDNLNQPRHALFHLHQASEKMLKGLLTSKRERAPKVHDLRALAMLVHAPDKIISECYDINALYQETRYMDEIVYSSERYDGLVEMFFEVIEWTRNSMP